MAGRSIMGAGSASGGAVNGVGRSRLVLVSRAPILGLITLLTLAATAAPALAARPANFGNEVWGWVVARQPTTAQYTPAARDQGNSQGGTNTVERLGRGQYRVRFGDLVTSDPVIHVSPLGTSPRLCVIDDFGFLDPDFGVLVDCRDRKGRHADSAFVANLLALFSLSDDLGYVVANEPMTPTYEPVIQYNSLDKRNSVERLGTGRWRVTLPDLGAPSGRGSVVVTASGLEGVVCRVVSWTLGLQAIVACRDKAGSLVNATFHATYLFGRGLKFEGQPNVAYVLADRPRDPSYTPTAGYRFSSAGIKPRVQRTGVGAYVVTLGGMPRGGSAQVTAYGSGSRRCVVASIRTSGSPQRVGVRCFSANGSSPADAKFTLAYAR